MQKLVVLRGLPASGKSTYAKRLVEVDGYKRVNRDDLRAMIDNGTWSKGREQYIRDAEIALAALYLDAGYHVVVDDTNLAPSAQQMWQDFAKGRDVRFEVKDFTDVPLEECIKRDRLRANSVGEDVIRRMYRDFLAPPAPAAPPVLPDKPWAIIVDMDGTLALFNKPNAAVEHHGAHTRNPYDATDCDQDMLCEPVADILRRYRVDHEIIVVSGRKEMYNMPTVRFLMRHGLDFYTHLLMRKDDDNRKDSIVKRELYENDIKGYYNVRFVLDDRTQVVQMWRSLGLKCLQVADGDF